MPTPTTFRPLAALTLTLLPLLPACERATDDPSAERPTAGDGDPNRTPTWGKPGAPPLSVATAAAPLCAGAGSRESDGSGGHPGPFGDASQGAGGGAGGAGGGWAEEPWYDAGVSSSDGQVPPPVPDAGVTPSPDASADAGTCGEPTFDADGGLTRL